MQDLQTKTKNAIKTLSGTQAQLEQTSAALPPAPLTYANIGGTIIPINPTTAPTSNVSSALGGGTVTPVVGGNPPAGGSGVVGATGGSDVQVLKALLKGAGYPSSLIDSSSSFLKKLVDDLNGDYQNAVEVFTTVKDYTFKDGTKLTSPFYDAYGIYNEGLAQPKTPSELFNAIEGYKTVAAQYKLDPKFTSVDYMKSLIGNNVDVATWAERNNTSELLSATQDPTLVAALQKMGFINGSGDIKDFLLDPNIGKEKMQQNRVTGAFAAEVLRRANDQTGIQFNKSFIAQQGARLTAAGLTEGQAATTAATAYQNIAEQLKPTVALAGIYGNTGKDQTQLTPDIQAQLEQEQLLGMPSEQRKRLFEQNQRAFEQAPGTGRYSNSQKSAAGII